MDLLDRLLGHDAWTTRQLLLLCEPLSDEQLDREFDIGHRSLRATFAHVIRNVEAWGRLLDGLPFEGRDRQPPQFSVRDMIEQFDEAAAQLARVSRKIADRGAWDEIWVDPAENPPRERTLGGTIAHVITHSMHHRAQLLYLMRLTGIEDRPEGDVLSWENRLHDD